MIRKKRARNGQTKYLYNIITTTTTALILYLTTTEISCCVVTPREFLATAGEVFSLGCNARPNNEQQSTVLNLKLENENKISETTIFRNPIYDEHGKIITRQFVADGYFLLWKSGLVDVTIQINETQLKHGGLCVCSCSTSTGSGNLVVLDKLSFVLNEGNPQTPGEALLDLDCSLSFSGSISSAVSVDLTIQDANGTELAAKRNLSLSWRSQGGSHHVNYSFIAQRNSKEQNFTCQMKAWNHSSSERRLLRWMSANYILNSNVTPETASVTVPVAVVSVLVVMVVVVIVIYMIRRKCRKRTCEGKSCRPTFVAPKSFTSTQCVRYEGGKPPIEHSTEDKKQKNNNKTGEDGEVIVVDNDLYGASSGRNEPTADESPLTQ